MSATQLGPLPAMNRQFKLAARPVGFPKESDFSLVTLPMPLPADGQVLVKSACWSVDPYMRGRITGVRTYADPVNIGDVMQGGAVGQVVQSKAAGLSPRDFVAGFWGWQVFAALDAKSLRKLDPEVAPVSTALGVLGMPGMTVYFGLLDICKPKPGETVLVSGAAGAVGSLVGQIAKINGCRTVGVAGTDDKIDWMLTDLGFDASFNYKSTSDYSAKLKELCPHGIDFYFDNVGGAITDAVLPLLNVGARISICGQISQYNASKPELGLRPYTYLLTKQARAEGFIVTQFANRIREGRTQMAQWLREGQLKYRETVVEGFENMPRALIGVLSGHNIGKMIVAVG